MDPAANLFRNLPARIMARLREVLSDHIGRMTLIVAVGNTLIAAIIWALSSRPGHHIYFPSLWLVAQCQGMCVYLVCIVLRLCFGRRLARWLLIVVGVLTGLPLGMLVAQSMGFYKAFDGVFGNPGALLRYAVLSAVFGLSFSYYFRSRWQLTELQRQQQAAALHAETVQKTALLSELRLLQAQIEPHFLFNTLANLHSLIGRDDALAKTLLERLNDYLRASLSHSRAQQATLGDEFDMLTAYLAIQQLRMGGRLQTVIELPADLRDEAFPPMLLQPLVENAIIHGIEPKLGAGEVRVHVERDLQFLRVSVVDDGVGFASAAASKGVGLANVRERLNALFGSAAQIEIKDNAPSGVRVELCLPHDKSAP